MQLEVSANAVYIRSTDLESMAELESRQAFEMNRHDHERRQEGGKDRTLISLTKPYEVELLVQGAPLHSARAEQSCGGGGAVEALGGRRGLQAIERAPALAGALIADRLK